jgi:hypothetical protein
VREAAAKLLLDRLRNPELRPGADTNRSLAESSWAILRAAATG